MCGKQPQARGASCQKSETEAAFLVRLYTVGSGRRARCQGMPFGKYLSIVPALFINATNRQGKSPRPSLFPRCFTAYPGQVRRRPPSPIAVVRLFVRSLFAAVKGLLSRPLGASLFACSMLQCLFFPCSRQLPRLVRPVIHLFYRLPCSPFLPYFPHALGFGRGSGLSASSAVQASRQGQGRPISLLSASRIPAVL